MTVPSGRRQRAAGRQPGHRDEVAGRVGDRAERVAAAERPSPPTRGEQLLHLRDGRGAVHPRRAEGDVPGPVGERHRSHVCPASRRWRSRSGSGIDSPSRPPAPGTIGGRLGVSVVPRSRACRLVGADMT